MERSDPIVRKQRLFWGVTASVLVADAFTKMLAVDLLLPTYVPRRIIGDAVRFTLVYNPGAAFGLHLGQYSRVIFSALTIAALFLLGHLYRTTKAGDPFRTLALSLVCGVKMKPPWDL